MQPARVFDTNMLVSKKREPNARKLTNANRTLEMFSILHYALGANVCVDEKTQNVSETTHSVIRS